MANMQHSQCGARLPGFKEAATHGSKNRNLLANGKQQDRRHQRIVPTTKSAAWYWKHASRYKGEASLFVGRNKRRAGDHPVLCGISPSVFLVGVLLVYAIGTLQFSIVWRHGYRTKHSQGSPLHSILASSWRIPPEPPNQAAAKTPTARTDGTSSPAAQDPSRPRSTLVLAAAPRGPRYATALWTQLECFVDPLKYDSIVVVTPTWAYDVTTQIVDKARATIPHFDRRRAGVVKEEETTRINQHSSTLPVDSNNKIANVSVLAKVNDRYDVGLWCDALDEILPPFYNSSDHSQDTFVLSNDSIFALRHFAAILDELVARNLSLTSLNYHLAKNESSTDKEPSDRSNPKDNPDYDWVESVLRGFSASGMQRYRDYACRLPPDHDYFCPHLQSKIKKKRCIVEHFEIAIAKLYPASQVMGLFPSDTSTPHPRWGSTWVSNQVFWNDVLLQQYQFPAAKTKNPRMIVNLTRDHPLLQECTQYMDWDFIQSELNYNQTMGFLEIPKRVGRRPNKAKQEERR